MFVNHIKNYLTTTTYNNLYDLKTKLTMHVLPPHNPKVGGSNPSRATNKIKGLRQCRNPFFIPMQVSLNDAPIARQRRGVYEA